jgi:hypothetical protein
MNNRIRAANILLALIIFLASCNLPTTGAEEALQLTAAAQTIQALTSATPGLPVPTFTPIGGGLPTLTPSSTSPAKTNTPLATSTSNCNRMEFVTDVNYPDGTIVTPGSNFTKTWRIKNIGTCAWSTSYAIVFSNGNSMNGPSSQAFTGNVNPGQSVDLSVNLTAPSSPGEYTGNWTLRDAAGVLFGHFYVQIRSQNPATITNTSAPPFAVISVNYVVSTWNSPGFVSCPKITANITTNGAGTVEYHWTRSDGVSGSTTTLIFGAAGTQSVSSEWSLGSVWAPAPDEWMGIYIDTPNHQDFGHAVMPPCTTP